MYFSTITIVTCWLTTLSLKVFPIAYVYVMKKEELCILVVIFTSAVLDVGGILQHQTV
jgi:hypothetical protein